VGQRGQIKHYVFVRRMPQTIVWGGLEKLLLEWLERINYQECQVTLAVTPAGKALFEPHFAAKNLPVEVVEFSLNFKGNMVKQFLEMYRFLRPLKPSTVILVQGIFTDFYLGIVLASFLVTRNHVYMHENLSVPPPEEKTSKYHWGVIPGIGLWWYRQKFYNNFRSLFSRKIFVVSQEIQDQLIRHWGYPRQKVAVAYHGVDLRKFSFSPFRREKMRKELNIPLTDFVFIISSRLTKEKSIDRAIEAFDRLTTNRDHVWLLILGEGNLRQSLEQFAQQKRCKDRIMFLGFRNNVEDFLVAADCYVSSSNIEGLSIALLEAMATGLPCVATNCTGTTELLERSQSGFLVEKTIEGVLQSMQKVVSLAPEEQKSLSQKGTRFIAEHFDVERQIAGILSAMQIPHNLPRGSQ
jgi:glycosyltransferase involved in cell wall biosynthesis